MLHVAGLLRHLQGIAALQRPLASGAREMGDSFRGAFKQVAAAAVVKRSIEALRDTFAEFGARVRQLSATSLQFGVSTQAVQNLEGRFGVAGVGANELRGSLSRLQQMMYDTTTEAAPEAIKAFGRLGVSIRDLHGKFKPATQVFDEAVAKLIAVEDPTLRAGKAMATVGEAGLRAANFWRDNGGIEGLREWQKSIEGFGVVLDHDVRAVGSLRMESSRLSLVLKDFANDFAGPLHEFFSGVAKDLFQWIRAMGPAGTASKPLREAMESLSSFRGPVVEFLKHAFTFAQNAMPALVAGAKMLGTVFLAFADGVKAVGQAFGEMGAVGGAVAVALFAAFFPMTALVAGLLLVFEDLVNFSKGIPSVTGDAIEGFRKWRDDMMGGGGEKPYWLRFLWEGYWLLFEEIPDAVKKLAMLVGGTLAGAFDKIKMSLRWIVDKLSSVTDRIGGSRGGASSEELPGDRLTPQSVAPGAQEPGVFQRAKEMLETGFLAASLAARAGALAAPPDPFRNSVFASAAQSPVATVSASTPGYAPAARAPVQVTVNSTVHVAGQVLDSNGLFKRIKPELDSHWKEQLVSTLQSTQP